MRTAKSTPGTANIRQVTLAELANQKLKFSQFGSCLSQKAPHDPIQNEACKPKPSNLIQDKAKRRLELSDALTTRHVKE